VAVLEHLGLTHVLGCWVHKANTDPKQAFPRREAVHVRFWIDGVIALEVLLIRVGWTESRDRRGRLHEYASRQHL
jgi:hypothetical protein